jgi:hypothetical protein
MPYLSAKFLETIPCVKSDHAAKYYQLSLFPDDILQGASSDEIFRNNGRAYVVGSVRERSGASKTYEQWWLSFNDSQPPATGPIAVIDSGMFAEDKGGITSSK